MKRVIVIGLDGLEPRIVEAMQQAGQLPNLSRLQEQGGYTRLRTTYPAQTPVAWATFATGANPGIHGVFDFLSRDPQTYLPVMALSKHVRKNRLAPPRVVNMRRGTAVWDLLSDAGIPTVAMRCPCTYPPDDIQGRMLSGVGVPDLRGGFGTPTFYTTRAGEKAEQDERLVQVTAVGNRVHTHLIGPRKPGTSEDLASDIILEIDSSQRKVTVRSTGQPAFLEVRLGEWSDWLKVRFKAGLLTTAAGIVRFYLRQLEPDLAFYASPINFDPSAPLFPISSPPEYAAEIEASLGTFYTIGMAEDHDGLIHGRFDESAYLDQCNIVLRERRRMMLAELNRFREGLFFCVFDTPDRVQHMFWRFREPEHPANRIHPAQEMAHVIEDHYAALDTIVGEAMEHADKDTLFVVLSDHGMNSFRRGVSLNTWLYENGFLALKGGVQPSRKANDVFFHDVDWAHTQAYALGLAGIYINLKDREAQGVVTTDQVPAVTAALARGLTGLRDPECGQVAVRSVMTRGRVYAGPHVAGAPDLIVNFSPGYRVSWDTPLGGVSEGLFEDNTRRWAADHVIDPDLIPGVLFMNQPFRQDAANLMDLAPTILAALGVPVGAAMEGGSLLTGPEFRSPARGRSPAADEPPNTTGDAELTEDDEELLRERLSGLGYL